MNRDLEETLAELGPEYRSVVTRLRAPFADAAPFADVAPLRVRAPFVSRRLPYLVAASLTVVAAFSIFALRPRPASAPVYTVYTAAYANDEFALRAILDSQRRDGSWSNDYLTMQNAAALRKANDDVSRVAYKRAVRYLRTKGLYPISDAELRARTFRVFPAG